MIAPMRKSGCVACEECPLRPLDTFREFNDKELAFMREFKTGELRVDGGATILVEGAHSAHLYTVLSGWGFRYKTLEDGRRQILNYVLPGDLIGLQGPVLGEMQHSVEALQPVVLCVFERERLHLLRHDLDRALFAHRGLSVAFGDDVDNDRLPEILLAAPYATVNGLHEAGMIQVVGSKSGKVIETRTGKVAGERLGIDLP